MAFLQSIILHASHNIFIQGFFTPLTGPTRWSPYVIDEFGIGLALAAIVVAYLFWRRRGKLQAALQEGHPVVPIASPTMP